MGPKPKTELQLEALATARRRRLQHASQASAHTSSTDCNTIPSFSPISSASSSAASSKRNTRNKTVTDNFQTRIQELQNQLVSLEKQLKDSQELASECIQERDQLQYTLSIKDQHHTRLASALLATERKLQRNRTNSRTVAKERLRWERHGRMLGEELEINTIQRDAAQSSNIDLRRKVSSALRYIMHHCYRSSRMRCLLDCSVKWGSRHLSCS